MAGVYQRKLEKLQKVDAFDHQLREKIKRVINIFHITFIPSFNFFLSFFSVFLNTLHFFLLAMKEKSSIFYTEK